MNRFGLTPLTSCEGDAVRVRRCLVEGFWKNAARFNPVDGTFRGVRGEGVSESTDEGGWLMVERQVLYVHPSSVMFTRKPRTGWVMFHEMEETKKTQYVYLHLGCVGVFDSFLACAVSAY